MPLFINVYNGYKSCSSLLETVGFSGPSRNFRDLILFTVASSRKNCPSARCASVSNTVFKDAEIFINHFVMLKHILK
jgi:hypothetical protein